MKSVTEILTIKLYYIDYKTPQKQASPVGVIAPDGANVRCYSMTRPAVLTYMSTASNARRRHRTPAGRPTLAPSFPLVVKNLQKLDMETECLV